MKNRTNSRLKLRTKLTRTNIIISASIILFGLGLIALFNFTNPGIAIAAATNDYRSINSGSWSSTSTWQRFNGSAWVSATSAPSSSQNVITIQSGHTVTITSACTVDQLVINSGGTLVLNSGVTMTLANGTGTDMNVSGTFTNAGTVTINTSATIAFQNGGTYRHNFTNAAGTIPNATWATGSTCEIAGYTTNTNAPSGLQTFYNFTWNCPSQTNSINLNGSLTSINGNFTVLSTGSGDFKMSNSAGTFSIGGDFTQSGGQFSVSSVSNSISTMNVSGDYTLSGGTFSIVDGSGGTGKVNLSGNYLHSGGILTVGGNSSTSGTIYFAKSGTQTFSSPSTSVTSNVDFVVNSGSTLDMGTDFCSGRNFTLSSGGGIIMGSPDGISSSGSSGNIQVSGTRSFSTGAEYTYKGSVAQVAGDALPTSVYRLTINNAAGLTLNGTTTVTNRLTLTSGKIYTNSNELKISSTSTSSITGQSSGSYVVGILRRSLGSNGNYVFPLGSDSNYELLTLTLSSASGLTDVLGKFVTTNPYDPSIPLDGIQAANVDLDSVLNYGYWSLAPSTALSSGTITVSLDETGYTNNVNSTTIFSVINRSNSSSAWTAPGNHVDNSSPISGSTVSASRSGMNTFGEYAIAYGQYLAFANPSLISGTGGQVGAVYLFPNVCGGVDAWMEIMELAGGATLNAIDVSNTGYNEAFQPFVNMAPNATSSIQWKITFKRAGTSIDTTLAKMSMTGVDVDGGSGIREFIEATMPKSYSLDPLTTLTVINLLGNYRAISGFATVANIDTSHHEAMYQLNYKNINSILYRTGAISTNNTMETRQTSLYFRSFMTGTIALPITLTYFNAKLKNDKVYLDWATAAEINNAYFTIERSSDARTFEPMTKVNGSGNSTVYRQYETVDREPLGGYSYYRLKQTDYDGKFSYSQIVSIKNGDQQLTKALEVTSVYPNPFDNSYSLEFNLQRSGSVTFTMLNEAGKIINEQKAEFGEGPNSIQFEQGSRLTQGIYYAVLTYNDQRVVRKLMKK